MRATRRVAVCCVFCVVGMSGLVALSSDLVLRAKAEAKQHTVSMKSLGFEPKKLVVRVGDSVVWTNAAFTTHTATSDDDGKTFDTGDVEQEKTSAPVTFAKAGEVGYHCKVHGKAMRGTIVVEAVNE